MQPVQLRSPAVRRSTLAVLGLMLAVFPTRAFADGAESGFWWSPSLRFTSVVDDNVFFEKDDTDGDVGFWIAPRVELGYRGAAFDVGADVGVDVRQYLDERSASDELVRAVGWAELGLAPGWSLRVSDAYVPQGVAVGLPEDDTRSVVQTNRAEAELLWWHELPAGRALTAGIVGTHFLAGDHAEVVPLAGGGVLLDPSFESDYLQGLAYAQLDSPLGERTTLWARTQAGYRDFDGLSDPDHSNVSVLLGVHSERWVGVELEAAAGGGAVLFAGLGTGYRALARARALKRFEGGLSVWLSGGYLRTPDLSGDAVGESTGELGFEQRFGSATALGLRLFLTHYDAPLQGGGSNLFGGGELALRRQLTRRLQVGVAYRHWNNGGSFSADDFEQNRVGVSFGYTL